MKFNARVGVTPEGPMTLTNEDILDVVKILVELRNGRGEVDDIDHLATAACAAWASWPRTSTARPCAHREGGEGASGQAETEP